MKILFVTLKPLQFNTSATLRNLALIEGIASLGHSVEILTLPATDNAQWLDKSLDLPAGCAVSYLTVPGSYQSVAHNHQGRFGKIKKLLLPLIRRLYHWFSIHDFTIMAAGKADKRHCQSLEYDMIISSSDPKSSHIAVKKLLKRGCSAKVWIQYWGDPLMADITNKTVWPSFVLGLFERSILRKADKIVYVSPFTYRQQCQAFKSLSDKFAFLPIPYRKHKVYPLKASYRYVCSYLGDYYSKSRNILPLSQAIGQLAIPAVFAGNTDVEINEDSITVLQRVTQAEVEQIEYESQILVCLLNSRGSQIPGKLYHYAASNKPILVIIDGDQKKRMRQYLETFNRFEFCDNTSDAIAGKIKQMMSDQSVYDPSPKLDPVNIAKEFLDFKVRKG